MPVKVYDGTNWVTVAGDGQQGAAATSSSIATWVKTASGGETSLSGNDDNSVSLSYTVGQELLYINGVLQKRAVDYVATTGTTITGLNALAASDVVTVWTVNAFSVTNAIPNSTITAKGNLIVGTGSGTYTAQAVGTDGQMLTANSAQADGVEWTTPASMTLLSTTTLSGATTTISSINQTYNQLYVLFTGISVNATAGAYPSVRPNGSSSICSVLNLYGTGGTVNSQAVAAGNISYSYNNWVLNNTNNSGILIIDNYASTTNYKPYVNRGQYINNSSVTESVNGAGNILTNTAITSLQFSADTSSFNGGTVKVYGVK